VASGYSFEIVIVSFYRTTEDRAMFAALAFALVAAAPPPSPVPPPSPLYRPRVVVIDLDDAGAGADAAQTLSSAVKDALAKRSSFDVSASTAKSSDCETQPAACSELAKTLGTELLVEGTVAKQVDAWSASIAMFDARKGVVVGREKVDGKSAAELVPLVAAAADRLAAKVDGVGFADSAPVPPAQSAPPSSPNASSPPTSSPPASLPPASAPNAQPPSAPPSTHATPNARSLAVTGMDPFMVGALQWLAGCGIVFVLFPINVVVSLICPPLVCLEPAVIGYGETWVGDAVGKERAPAIWPIVAAYGAELVAGLVVLVSYVAILGGTTLAATANVGNNPAALVGLILVPFAIVSAVAVAATVAVPVAYGLTATTKLPDDDGSGAPGFLERGGPPKPELKPQSSSGAKTAMMRY
jgi:TolB-like protein